VLQAGQAAADEAARKALAVFSETYWPPLYTFVRRRGYSSSDAQDVVQGFFLHMFEKDTLSRADQEKGKLRTFLLGALQNYLLKQRERMGAMKRGGGKAIVSFDDQLIDAEAAMRATMHLNEVASYDAAWASSVVERAWKNVRERFEGEGKRDWFDALRPFVAGGTVQAPQQKEVAERLGTSVENLRVAISRLRQHYRHALRAEVASTVSDPKDIDNELHYLYEVLTS
jgi:DNA-directed RNA polymerase specialized sigma24 family protein